MDEPIIPSAAWRAAFSTADFHQRPIVERAVEAAAPHIARAAQAQLLRNMATRSADGDLHVAAAALRARADELEDPTPVVLPVAVERGQTP